MDRHWLLTNTAYGNRLPGDARGFVGNVWEHRPLDPDKRRVAHNVPGTDCDRDLPKLEAAAHSQLKCPPIHLTVVHAESLLKQFQETARIRGWTIQAVAIMFDHWHMVVGVLGDPAPSKILGDFKSWGTRALTKQFGAPLSETWWTQSGSKRKLPNEQAILAAIHYALYDQPNPLITWSPDTGLHYGNPPKPNVDG